MVALMVVMVVMFVVMVVVMVVMVVVVLMVVMVVMVAEVLRGLRIFRRLPTPHGLLGSLLCLLVGLLFLLSSPLDGELQLAQFDALGLALLCGQGLGCGG